mmetsp:Transcript_7728/g.11812  ORF Transcript_7728/g.11812 Transcript_7728/m.11812 type:complete len:194 (-) Transcript_7728:111-692(-)|eukprot:CAMPEP_0178915884 /NCGR_PEP_ID=MMETSP0786-20121207/12296_1 /TAXON_ID=186022 /ORGANISM="Thalassionema frauenfeldii, Strain CCMP 1798" /LENGTH=193 /DNA_ID=CAMNT_0020589087 /DNA_START=277 /DNA_END=858 /DNA_ORIENTATION=-
MTDMVTETETTIMVIDKEMTDMVIEKPESESESENVILISKDGESFQVPTEVAKMSELVHSMMEDGEDASEFPLPNVSSSTLKRVIDFCRHHCQEEPMAEIPKPLKSGLSDVVSEWYATYTTQLEQEALFELILAANYMDIKPLLNLACATVATMIQNKTVEEIRTTFNITNDFSPEEESQIREENKWCEESN